MTSFTVAGADPYGAVALAREVSRSRRNKLIQKFGYGFGFPIALLLIWELLVLAGLVDRRFFPSPSRIFWSGIDTLASPTQSAILISDVLATLSRLGIGYVVGATLGIVVGVLMAVYTPLRQAVAPMVYATFPMPKLAIYPLLIVAFGIGDGSKMALVTLGVFYMTCINSLSGVLYANPIYQDVSRAFRMPAYTHWMRVIVPSALPSIMTGLKLGIGQALILVVSAEFVSAQNGLGYFIWNSWQMLDVPRMFVGLVIIAIIGGFTVLVGNVVERRLIPWARH